MALQLIYTSAPRLLQAGRTGFGTVAAHPGIPSWLVGEIERASQFSRVPGLDAARVVLRHMIFGQGDRVHHVLSRIQDARADYTGRTNHIAHHFVFIAAEAAKATTLGVTPADALAFLESHNLWQASWSGEPISLGDDSILPVESIPKTITLPAETYWGTLVPGRPECAAILAPGKTSEACWIVYPQGWGHAIVYAMGESLALHSNPWGVSFANDLQPTDNEQQIAWRGIPADSPLLPKAQSSVRPCIDLSNPNDLQFQPLPEYAEEARTGKKPLPKSLSPAPSATKTRTDTKNLPEPPKKRLEPKAITLLSKTKNEQRRNPYAIPLVVLLGTLLLSLGGLGGLWGYNVYTKGKEMSAELASLKSEITKQIPTQGIPDLTKFENPDELRNLSNFLKEILNDNITAAEESLKKINGISAEWNEWREVCNKLLDDKNKEIETKKLDDLYAKACQGDALNDKDWDQFQTLAKKIHPEDKIWENALMALSFLRELDPDPKEFINWMQNPGMPQDRSELYNIVFKKINGEKIKIYNDEISKETDKNIFIDKLGEHLKDWPLDQKESLSSSAQYNSLFKLHKLLGSFNEKSHSEIEHFNSLGLKVPKFMDSKKPEDFESVKVLEGENSNKGELPPIYLIAENSKKREFKPATSSSSLQKPDKWHTYNSIPINWNIFSSSNFDSWEPRSESQFESEHKNIQAYYVTDQNSSPKTIKFFVIEKDKLDKFIPDFSAICTVDNSSITLKKNFITFLDRIYKDKEVKFITFLELKYTGDQFHENNLPKQKLDNTKPIALIDLNQTINNKKSGLDIELGKNSEKKINLEKDLETKKSDIENSFPFKPITMKPWEDFKNKIDKEIDNHHEKNKLENFKQIFKRSKSLETPEGFIEEYNGVKEKEKVLAALSHFPEQQKKWFFFDGNEWSKESQEKFLKQFNKTDFDTINKDIENKNNQIKVLETTNKNLQQKIAKLEELQTAQKATLNFYLEESDADPFLTTEVTIPFRPQHEAPGVFTKPPPSP